VQHQTAASVCLVCGYSLTQHQRHIMYMYMAIFMSTYQRSYLFDYTCILYQNRFNIFCSSIAVLQSGGSFVMLRWGHKKCPEKSHAPVIPVRFELSMRSGNSRRNGIRLKLEMLHVNSSGIGLLERWEVWRMKPLTSRSAALQTYRKTFRH